RSGIEEGVVLERDTGGLDGLQRGSPFGEDAVADSRGLEAAGRGGSSALLGGKRACAPVYDDGEATHVREPSTGVGVPRGLPIGLATGTGAPALPTELVYAGRAGRRPARGKGDEGTVGLVAPLRGSARFGLRLDARCRAGGR